MALILALLVWIIGIVWALLQLFATGMSDDPASSVNARSTFWSTVFGSTIVAGFVASTHWVHFSW